MTDNLIELGEIDPQWTAEEKAAHQAEFGVVAAVDFIEQCVIEAGPETAPWGELQSRVAAGEFDEWPPIWYHAGDSRHHFQETEDKAVSPHIGDARHVDQVAQRSERIRRAHQRVTGLQRMCTSRNTLNSIEI